MMYYNSITGFYDVHTLDVTFLSSCKENIMPKVGYGDPVMTAFGLTGFVNLPIGHHILAQIACELAQYYCTVLIHFYLVCSLCTKALTREVSAFYVL